MDPNPHLAQTPSPEVQSTPQPQIAEIPETITAEYLQDRLQQVLLNQDFSAAPNERDQVLNIYRAAKYQNQVDENAKAVLEKYKEVEPKRDIEALKENVATILLNYRFTLTDDYDFDTVVDIYRNIKDTGELDERVLDLLQEHKDLVNPVASKEQSNLPTQAGTIPDQEALEKQRQEKEVLMRETYEDIIKIKAYYTLACSKTLKEHKLITPETISWAQEVKRTYQLNAKKYDELLEKFKKVPRVLDRFLPNDLEFQHNRGLILHDLNKYFRFASLYSYFIKDLVRIENDDFLARNYHLFDGLTRSLQFLQRVGQGNNIEGNTQPYTINDVLETFNQERLHNKDEVTNEYTVPRVTVVNNGEIKSIGTWTAIRTAVLNILELNDPNDPKKEYRGSIKIETEDKDGDTLIRIWDEHSNEWPPELIEKAYFFYELGKTYPNIPLGTVGGVNQIFFRSGQLGKPRPEFINGITDKCLEMVR